MEEKKGKGCVYLVKMVGLTPIKIGYSDDETPFKRLQQFKVCAPYGVRLFGFIRSFNAVKLESVLHKRYKAYRLEGEWFDITEDEALKIIEIYSEKEDIEEMNNFQIEWCRKIEMESSMINDNSIYNDSIIGNQNLIDKIRECKNSTLTLKFFERVLRMNSSSDRIRLNKSLSDIIGEPNNYRWSKSKTLKILEDIMDDLENS